MKYYLVFLNQIKPYLGVGDSAPTAKTEAEKATKFDISFDDAGQLTLSATYVNGKGEEAIKFISLALSKGEPIYKCYVKAQAKSHMYIYKLVTE